MAQQKPVPFPPGPYDVIYADPPWRYRSGTCDPKDQIEHKYPTMLLRDICKLPVIDMVADHATLFMWTTAPKAEEASQVVYAWGFEYQTQIIWHKLKMGLGWYSRIEHELLYICTRGSPGVPPVHARPRSVIRSPRMLHSRKPDLFRTMIVNMYPNARRIELFARQRKPGWDAWGNEV